MAAGYVDAAVGGGRIKILTNEGNIIEVDENVISCSRKVANMLEILRAEEGAEADIVPLQYIRTFVLQKIVSWASRHRNDPPEVEIEADDFLYPIPQLNLVTTWDLDFINHCTPGEIMDVYKAAVHLEIPNLVKLTKIAIINLMRDKSPPPKARCFLDHSDDYPDLPLSLRCPATDWCIAEILLTD